MKNVKLQKVSNRGTIKAALGVRSASFTASLILTFCTTQSKLQTSRAVRPALKTWVLNSGLSAACFCCHCLGRNLQTMKCTDLQVPLMNLGPGTPCPQPHRVSPWRPWRLGSHLSPISILLILEPSVSGTIVHGPLSKHLSCCIVFDQNEIERNVCPMQKGQVRAAACSLFQVPAPGVSVTTRGPCHRFVRTAPCMSRRGSQLAPSHPAVELEPLTCTCVSPSTPSPSADWG